MKCSHDRRMSSCRLSKARRTGAFHERRKRDVSGSKVPEASPPMRHRRIDSPLLMAKYNEERSATMEVPETVAEGGGAPLNPEVKSENVLPPFVIEGTMSPIC